MRYTLGHRYMGNHLIVLHEWAERQEKKEEEERLQSHCSVINSHQELQITEVNDNNNNCVVAEDRMIAAC